MNSEKIIAKMICCNRDITFSVDNNDYAGTIQSIGNYGVSVLANLPLKIPEGKKIRMSILNNNHEDLKSAEIVWSDESGFGAKFLHSAE
jgi:hypothetical protein